MELPMDSEFMQKLRSLQSEKAFHWVIEDLKEILDRLEELCPYGEHDHVTGEYGKYFWHVTDGGDGADPLEHPLVKTALQAKNDEILVLEAQLFHVTEARDEAQSELCKLEAWLEWQEKQRQRPSKYMRDKVLGWAGECMMCGATSLLTVDRVWPESKGGKYTWDNVQCLCQRCNSHDKRESTDEHWDRRRFYPAFRQCCHEEQVRGESQGVLF